MMNDDKDRDQIPSLKELVNGYQDTHAPPGFAERVAAHVRDEAAERRKFIPSRIFTSSSGKDEVFVHGRMAFPWILAASFAVVIISAVVVMSVAFKPEAEPQLVQQDKTKSENTVAKSTQTPLKDSAVERVTVDNPPVTQDAPVAKAKVIETPAVKQTQDETQIAKVVDEPGIDSNWDQSADDNDFTSVAVLWEVSDWLTEEAVVTPDFSDMPALGEIDALFEQT